MSISEIITSQKKKISGLLDIREMAMGELIFNNGSCQMLSQSSACYEIIVTDESAGVSAEYKLHVEVNGSIIPETDNKQKGWDRYSYACLLQMENEISLTESKDHMLYKKYTREGMIARVIKERQLKADNAKYHIQWAYNIYGDHVLTNEKGVKYKVFLRDFENETGYSNSLDSKLNKLGTTKHIMYAFRALKENKELYEKLDKDYPFIEVFCDPLNDNSIAWYYPGSLSTAEASMINKYFHKSHHISHEEVINLMSFLYEAKNYSRICIRPEVVEKVEEAYDKKMLESLKQRYTPDFSKIKADLYPYQKEGISFALFRKTAIIADEMGLGKTIQAIGTAILKKEFLGCSKTLVVCPASLKEQWKKEIEKFSSEKAVVVTGTPEEREAQYKDSSFFFFIINYETVLRDQQAINKAGVDFLILDEAQRAKNFETRTASSLKRLNVKHKLVITGTPIENRLIDIYSIMNLLDPDFFGPLWEFSYQYCLFDPDKPNKINGYYNLQKLNKKLVEVLLRREKRKVIKQLPNIRQINIPVRLSPLQADYHASYASGLAKIIRKKYLTPFDMQKLQLLLANMRMVCDSTWLIDETTNESPKLEELRYILFDKLDIRHNHVKIIIFSEWVKVHQLIGKMLRENEVGFVELNGKVPVKSRGDLIRKFENNPEYKIFLSTEAGGVGLNLQVADTLINFELPWNPAKKNQRTGRIDRIGQRSNTLTIYSFITRNSIEERIASGLLVKQSLFDGVLGEDNNTDFVDFSKKGRSQFIEQLEEFITDAETKRESDSLLQQEELAEVANMAEVTDEIDVAEDIAGIHDEPSTPDDKDIIDSQIDKTDQMETVMNSGIQFLSGLFKMTTGKEMSIENQKVEIDRKTGEVTIRFKLPV